MRHRRGTVHPRRGPEIELVRCNLPVLASGPMRIACYLATILAAAALVLVLVSGDSQGPRAVGDQGDPIGMSQPDLSDVHLAEQTPILPPLRRDIVVIDHRVPASRLSPLEVFRPPQARA